MELVIIVISGRHFARSDRWSSTSWLRIGGTRTRATGFWDPADGTRPRNPWSGSRNSGFRLSDHCLTPSRLVRGLCSKILASLLLDGVGASVSWRSEGMLEAINCNDALDLKPYKDACKIQSNLSWLIKCLRKFAKDWIRTRVFKNWLLCHNCCLSLSHFCVG